MDPGLAQTLLGGALLAVLALMLDRRERARYAELKAQIDTNRTEVRTDMAALRSEVRSDIAEFRSEVRAEMAAIRSDLMQLALALGVKARPQTG